MDEQQMQAIQSCQSMEALFSLWKKVQVEDTKTLEPQSNIPRGAFLPDGVIDKARYDACALKVLFVAKESDQFDEKKTLEENTKDFKEDNFWLQRVVNQNKLPKHLGTRLIILTHALLTQDFDHVVKERDILKSIAFMNLNKRGGYSSCKSGSSAWNRVVGYVDEYAPFIAREIELIAPDLIVCCSKNGEVQQLLEQKVIPYLNGRPYRLVTVWHPSAHGSHQAHLDNLRQAMQNSSARNAL